MKGNNLFFGAGNVESGKPVGHNEYFSSASITEDKYDP